MSPFDIENYRERARIERARAAQATKPQAADIHLELASLYEKLVQLEEHSPALHIVSEMRQAL